MPGKRRRSDKPVLNGADKQMTDPEIREMLRVNTQAVWTAPCRTVDTTLHQDGSATIHIRLSEQHVRGLAQTW